MEPERIVERDKISHELKEAIVEEGKGLTSTNEGSTISSVDVEDADVEVPDGSKIDVGTSASSRIALGKQTEDEAVFDSGEVEKQSSSDVDLNVQGIDIEKSYMLVPLYSRTESLNLNLDKEEVVTIANAMIEAGRLSHDIWITTPIDSKETSSTDHDEPCQLDLIQ